MLKKFEKLFALVLAGGMSFFFVIAMAECADYPNKTIKIVVPANAGSGEDVEARGIAPFLHEVLGVNVLIENQPGAGGKIALERFQKTEPDGYTIICNNLPKSIIYEHMYKVAFKTKDFTPIFAWSLSYNMLVVHAGSWKTLDEFLNAAKAKTMAGGLSAIGGVTHLASLAAIDVFGLKVNWVPYEGAVGSLMALAGKHINFSIVTSTTAIPLIQAGIIRPLVIFSETRDTLFPDVPTSKELGYAVPPVITVRGVQAPPKTPPSIVKVLEEACFKAIKDPAYVGWADKRKMVLNPMSSRQYFDWIVKEAYPTVEKYKYLMSEEKK
jgi:tripartite-type tricarboxylate transporter receptor subunit TctC